MPAPWRPCPAPWPALDATARACGIRCTQVLAPDAVFDYVMGDVMTVIVVELLALPPQVGALVRCVWGQWGGAASGTFLCLCMHAF